MKTVRILLIDGQGGKMGQALAKELLLIENAEITAVGANSAATAAMMKAGVSRGATGENAVVVNAGRADVIVGPVGIVIADSMLGEITPRMASAVGQSRAEKILLPIGKCENTIVGCRLSASELIPEAARAVRQAVERILDR